MKKLLVVVDMQNDFVSGSLGSEAAKNAVGEVKRLIARERAQGADAAFTLDTHGEDYADTQEGRLLPVRHCMRNTAGWNVVPELVSETEGAVLFEKETFASVQLAEYAKKGGYGEITLCGVCTDICVVSNAMLLKAFCPESAIKVAARACAGTNRETHAAALQTRRCCQIIIE